MSRILIIDDEEDIRDVLKLILESIGHEVNVASNGNEAIELQRMEPADVVITDIIMPGKDGVTTIKEMRQEFPDIGVIAISGGGEPVEYKPDAIKTTAYLAAAKQVGADMVITKPFERKELIQSVSELLGKLN
jgi:CheY-like chemotaxis protein